MALRLAPFSCRGPVYDYGSPVVLYASRCEHADPCLADSYCHLVRRNRHRHVLDHPGDRLSLCSWHSWVSRHRIQRYRVAYYQKIHAFGGSYLCEAVEIFIQIILRIPDWATHITVQHNLPALDLLVCPIYRDGQLAIRTQQAALTGRSF